MDQQLLLNNNLVPIEIQPRQNQALRWFYNNRYHLAIALFSGSAMGYFWAQGGFGIIKSNLTDLTQWISRNYIALGTTIYSFYDIKRYSNFTQYQQTQQHFFLSYPLCFISIGISIFSMLEDNYLYVIARSIASPLLCLTSYILYKLRMRLTYGPELPLDLGRLNFLTHSSTAILSGVALGFQTAYIISKLNTYELDNLGLVSSFGHIKNQYPSLAYTHFFIASHFMLDLFNNGLYENNRFMKATIASLYSASVLVNCIPLANDYSILHVPDFTLSLSAIVPFIADAITQTYLQR